MDGGGVINKATGDQTLTRHLRQDAGAHSHGDEEEEEEEDIWQSSSQWEELAACEHHPPTHDGAAAQSVARPELTIDDTSHRRPEHRQLSRAWNPGCCGQKLEFAKDDKSCNPQ